MLPSLEITDVDGESSNITTDGNDVEESPLQNTIHESPDSGVIYQPDLPADSRVNYQPEHAEDSKHQPVSEESTRTDAQRNLDAEIAHWPAAARDYVNIDDSEFGMGHRYLMLSLASVGLLPKWSWAQTPDLRSIRAACSLLEGACPNNNEEQLARNFVILFGIRGHIGVSWAASEMLRMSHSNMTVKDVISTLKKRCSEARHMIAKFGESWSVHNDGLARKASGKYWLDAALLDEEGVLKSIGLVQACVHTLVVDGFNDSEDVDTAIEVLAKGLMGVMPTSPGCHANKYTAQSRARSLWLTCATTEHDWRQTTSAFHIPDGETFSLLWQYQAHEPLAALFQCHWTLELCVRALASMGVLASSAAIMISPLPACTWVDAFVTACEFRQLLEHKDIAALQQMVSTARGNRSQWIALIQQGLDYLDSHPPGLCHSRAITQLMMDGIDNIPSDTIPTTAVMVCPFPKKKTKAQKKKPATDSTALEVRAAGCMLAKMREIHITCRDIQDSIKGGRPKRKVCDTGDNSDSHEDRQQRSQAEFDGLFKVKDHKPTSLQTTKGKLRPSIRLNCKTEMKDSKPIPEQPAPVATRSRHSA